MAKRVSIDSPTLPIFALPNLASAMDEYHIPLKLRPIPDSGSMTNQTTPQSIRRFSGQRTSAPLPLSLSNSIHIRTSVCSSDLVREQEKPPVPVKHPRRVASMPKVYQFFQSKETLPPWTWTEWGLAVDEVKRLYLRGRYKLCAEKSIDILENPRGRIYDLHSLFFSFYAATALELQALPLHPTSPLKLSLLKTSKSYYEISASYIPFAESSITKKFPTTTPTHTYSSSTSSYTTTLSQSSPRSSTSSVFSKNSPFASPTSSIYSDDEAEKHQENEYLKLCEEQSLRKTRSSINIGCESRIAGSKKKVVFQETSRKNHRLNVSYGHNEYAFPTPPRLSTSPSLDRIRDDSSSVKIPISPGPPPTIPLPPLPLTSKPPLASKSRNASISSLQPSTQTQTPIQIEKEIKEKQAIIRYQSLLWTLKPQISYHLSSISKQIHETSKHIGIPSSRIENPPISPISSRRPPQANTKWRQKLHEPELQIQVQIPSQSNYQPQTNHNLDIDISPSSSLPEKTTQPPSPYPSQAKSKSSLFPDPPKTSEMTPAEKRARIESGKARGWNREKGKRRFDGGRWERLCERVLGEM